MRSRRAPRSSAGREQGSTHPTGARRLTVRILDGIGLAASGVGVLLLLGYLLGSLFLTGGQLGATTSPNYDAVVAWPLFEVPVWLAIGLAGITFLAFVPMAALVRSAEAPRILRAIQFTSAGICAASLCWALAFPSSIGANSWPEPTRTVWGAHWIAIVIGLAAVALVLVVGWRALREHMWSHREALSTSARPPA